MIEYPRPHYRPLDLPRRRPTERGKGVLTPETDSRTAKAPDCNTNAPALDHPSSPARRLVTGSGWNLFGNLVTMGTAFVATPFVIRLFGPRAYGAWTFVNLLLG